MKVRAIGVLIAATVMQMTVNTCAGEFRCRFLPRKNRHAHQRRRGRRCAWHIRATPGGPFSQPHSGHPNVIIQYMLGAGGNVAANYLYNVAPKDGTAIGLPLQDLIFNARIGSRRSNTTRPRRTILAAPTSPGRR